MLKDKNKYVYWTKFQKDTSPLLRRFLLAASGLFLIAAGLHIVPFFTQQGAVDYLFFTVDFSFAIILFLEFLLKNKVPLIIRVLSLISTTIFISILSYVRSGLLGSAEISLTFMIVSFYVFLP
ncbi:histidine kinase, partial [Leptospira bourretii]